ncbi:MAG TPA: FecR domain-containing protein [Puia sp.]|nr:FecR domain-containing protein [Puia sp.]
MMNIDEIRDLLERYRQGTCTVRERQLVEDWYAALRPGDEEPLSEEVIEASLERVRERLPWVGEDAVPMGRMPPVGRGAGGRWNGWGLLIAAAAFVALVVAVWMLRAPSSKVTPVGNALADVVVSTNRGETRQVVLPDGSTMELNAGTEVHYSKLFGVTDRSVDLVRGEAYFQVVSDAVRPFVVTSGGLQTKVLGTSFDLRAYEGHFRVAVLSGKVEVGDRVLEKGMLARMDSSGLVTERFDGEEEVAAWRQGWLYFKDASFEQIAFEMGNKYNIRVVNASRKRVWSYTGLFRSGSLQEVIETICLTEGLHYRFTNGELVIF